MSHGDHTKVVQPVDHEEFEALRVRVDMMSLRIGAVAEGCDAIADAVKHLCNAISQLPTSNKDLAEAVAEQRNRLNALEERFETLYNECSEMAVKIEE